MSKVFTKKVYFLLNTLSLSIYKYMHTCMIVRNEKTIFWFLKFHALRQYSVITVLMKELHQCRKRFIISLLLLGAILRVFEVYFWLCFSILGSYSTSYLMNFLQIVLVLLWKLMFQEKIHSTYPSAEGIMQYFWTYIRFDLQCLEKLKTFP